MRLEQIVINSIKLTALLASSGTDTKASYFGDQKVKFPDQSRGTKLCWKQHPAGGGYSTGRLASSLLTYSRRTD